MDPGHHVGLVKLCIWSTATCVSAWEGCRWVGRGSEKGCFRTGVPTLARVAQWVSRQDKTVCHGSGGAGAHLAPPLPLSSWSGGDSCVLILYLATFLNVCFCSLPRVFWGLMTYK